MSEDCPCINICEKCGACLDCDVCVCTKSPSLSNSTPKEEKASSKSSFDETLPTLKQVRAIIMNIQKQGKNPYYKISRACGWTDSRVSQILTKWENPQYVSPNSKRQIYEKLKKCLESVSRLKKDSTSKSESYGSEGQK